MTPEERAADRFQHEKPYPNQFSAKYGFEACIREEVEPLEASHAILAKAVAKSDAELAKLRALVRGLVDALEGTKSNTHWWRAHPSEEWIADAMSDAKEAGFTPTNTEDK